MVAMPTATASRDSATGAIAAAASRDDRGFFERAGDEIASWFGDDDAERRRREERIEMSEGRGAAAATTTAARLGDHARPTARPSTATAAAPDRGLGTTTAARFARGGSSERDYNRGWKRELRGGRRSRAATARDRGRDYRPMAGDYGRGRSEREIAIASVATPYGRDEYRRTSCAGSVRPLQRQDDDPHYHSVARSPHGRARPRL